MSETNPEHKNLSKLGEGGTHPNRNLETFPNRNPERDYVVELKTDETLGTGSSYGNTSLDGTVYGVGYQKDLDAMFVRVEGTYMDFDGVTLTANDNTIHLKSLDGLTGKLSIGKSF